MELTNNQLSVLKNISGINAGLIFKADDEPMFMKRITNDILLRWQPKNSFPFSFAIASLPDLLKSLSLVDEPILSFTDDFLTITNEKKTTKIAYQFSSPLSIFSPEETQIKKVLELDSKITPDKEFILSKETLKQIVKASNAMNLDKLRIVSDGNSIIASLSDSRNVTRNEFTTQINEGEMSNFDKFDVTVTTEAFSSILVDDYEVAVSAPLIRFYSAEYSLTYWIAID